MKIEIEIPDKYAETIQAFEKKSGKSFAEFAAASLTSVLEVLPRVHRLKLDGVTILDKEKEKN